MIQFHNGIMLLILNHDNYEAFKPGDGADTIDGRGGYDGSKLHGFSKWYDNRPFSINSHRWLGEMMIQ